MLSDVAAVRGVVDTTEDRLFVDTGVTWGSVIFPTLGPLLSISLFLDFIARVAAVDVLRCSGGTLRTVRPEVRVDEMEE